jgi:hypothetical protein
MSEVGEKKGKWPRFHSTFDVIAAIEAGRFPDKVMMTVHPQRWTDDPLLWTRELISQNIKNVVKTILISRAKTQRRKGTEVGGQMSEGRGRKVR